MPQKTEDELEILVDEGKIIGFTLDTTEFHHAGYNYDAKRLKALRQFAETDIKVVFSEVVINEVIGHVEKDISEKAGQARSGLRQIIKAARLDHDLAQITADLGIAVDPHTRSKELLDKYIADIGAECVMVDNGTSVRHLHDLYFSSLPPFSKKANKKNEFPDAIALLSLEYWATQNAGYLLVVSNDGDWADFAEKSDHLICVPQLAGALNLFNRNDAVVAARLAANIASGAAQKLSNCVKRELESAVETFEVEASAHYYYEAEDEYGVIDNWEPENERFDVLASDADSVTVAFTVLVNATFHASFRFEIRDPIDRDYISIGGTKAVKFEEFSVQMVVTVSRNDDKDDPDVIDSESEGTTLSVDFGYVELDLGDDRNQR